MPAQAITSGSSGRADVLPLMEGAEYDDLVPSVRIHGQRDPIIVSDGMILDGRNRYRACCDCGRPPVIRDLKEVAGDDADARQYVIDKNLLRRHLNPSQRAFYMAQYATFGPGRREAKVQSIETSIENSNGRARPFDLTNNEARAMAQVGETVFKHAKIVYNEGTEEEKDDVRDGRRSARAVATEIKSRRPDRAPIGETPPDPDPPPDMKGLSGARLIVPDGQLASEWCRKGMALEEAGKGPEQARDIAQERHNSRQRGWPRIERGGRPSKLPTGFVPCITSLRERRVMGSSAFVLETGEPV